MARRGVRIPDEVSGWATTVWVDPGGTTGWGVMSVYPELLVTDKPIQRNIVHWICGESTGNENQMASEMLELFSLWEDAAVGIESFDLRQLAVQLSPVSVTAKIEYGLWLMEKWDAEDEERDIGRGRLVFKQSPSLAKTTLTDDRQRDWGLWVPGKDHKRDAIKHCFTFMSRAQKIPRMRYAAWPHLYRKEGTLLKQVPKTSKRRLY
jgi:hypothetical protein